MRTVGAEESVDGDVTEWKRGKQLDGREDKYFRIDASTKGKAPHFHKRSSDVDGARVSPSDPAHYGLVLSRLFSLQEVSLCLYWDFPAHTFPLHPECPRMSPVFPLRLGSEVVSFYGD